MLLLIAAAAVLAQTAGAASAPRTYVLWSVAGDGSSLRAETVLPSDLFASGERLADWSPDRTRVAVVGSTVVVATLDGADRSTIALPQTLVPQDARFSPDGTRLVVTAADPACGAPVGRLDCLELLVARADGSGTAAVVAARGSAAAWSPDGRRLAYVGRTDRYEFGSLYLAGSDGAHRRQVATEAAGWVRPTFSHNGTRIAFGSRTGPRIARAAGALVHGRESGGGYSAAPALWSPDGTRLLFSVVGRGVNRSILAVLTVADHRRHLLTNSEYNGTNDVPLVWARDGKSAVFQRACDISPCRTAVYRVDIATGAKRRLSADDKLWLDTRWVAGRLSYFSATG